MRLVFLSTILSGSFSSKTLIIAVVFQELLALEERIGNVSTGLSEEEVTKLLKQRKFSSWRLEASVEEEPCCICQV
jgi:E3 ubiquitin-protein ligase Arkadia